MTGIKLITPCSCEGQSHTLISISPEGLSFACDSCSEIRIEQNEFVKDVVLALVILEGV